MKTGFNRLQIIGFFLVTTAFIVVILSHSLQDDSLQAAKEPARAEGKNKSISARSDGESNPKLENRERARRQGLRSATSANVDTLDSFTEIEQCLSNDHISNEEAADQLAKIALDATRPEAERLEAIEHGINLGFDSLLPLSSDPNLPVSLAESYLHGLHGHDQVKEQIHGALGLLNHHDSEIRQEAGILIGFLIDAEDDNESFDILRAKADVFLNQPEEVEEETSGQ